MGKRKYSKRDLELVDRLKYENAKLKRQVTSLRKQIQRIDIDRYENIKDLIYKHYHEDMEEKISKEREKLKRKWECHSCGTGFLKIYLINRFDGLVYYRKCTECSHRTKIKPYHDKVEGIKDEE